MIAAMLICLGVLITLIAYCFYKVWEFGLEIGGEAIC